MEYKPELVPALLEAGEILDIDGLTVECKRVPDGAPRRLDPRQLPMELAMAAENAERKGPPPPTPRWTRDPISPWACAMPPTRTPAFPM